MQAQPAAAGGNKGGATPAKPGQNIYAQSAGAYTGALNGTAQAMQAKPMMVNPALAKGQINYNPAQGGTPVDAAYAAYQGYEALMAQGVPADVAADQVRAQMLSQTELSPYMNPFTSNVIDQSVNQLDRSRQMVQTQNAGAAVAAGAFGGSRHGLVEAETNRGFADQVGSMTAGLNAANFQQAQQAAFQDIGNRMQADFANQGANLQAGMFNNATKMQATLANQQAENAARAFGAGAANSAAQFNASSRNAAQQFNSAQRQSNNQFNAGLNLQGQQANLQNKQFNASQTQSAKLANQGAKLQSTQTKLAGANQLGNLSNLGFGMGNTVQQQKWQQGLMQQAMQQQRIDAAKGQWTGKQGATNQSMAQLLAALGGANMGQNTQKTGTTPGFFNYLSLGLGAV